MCVYLNIYKEVLINFLKDTRKYFTGKQTNTTIKNKIYWIAVAHTSRASLLVFLMFQRLLAVRNVQPHENLALWQIQLRKQIGFLDASTSHCSTEIHMATVLHCNCTSNYTSIIRLLGNAEVVSSIKCLESNIPGIVHFWFVSHLSFLQRFKDVF